MKDELGRQALIGDRVELWEGESGLVVCDIDNRHYSDHHPQLHWAYLKAGILIETDSGELFHMTEADEHFRVLEPK